MKCPDCKQNWKRTPEFELCCSNCGYEPLNCYEFYNGLWEAYINAENMQDALHIYYNTSYDGENVVSHIRKLELDDIVSNEELHKLLIENPQPSLLMEV